MRLERLCLDESLEAYAKRQGLEIDTARAYWRAESLRLLHVGLSKEAALHAAHRDLCRIAPGVAVPTSAVTWSDEP